MLSNTMGLGVDRVVRVIPQFRSPYLICHLCFRSFSLRSLHQMDDTELPMHVKIRTSSMRFVEVSVHGFRCTVDRQ